MDQRFLPLLRTQRSSGTRTFPGKSLMAVWALGIPLLVSGCGGDSGGSGGTVPPPVPPSVAAQTIYSFGGSNTDAMSGSESGVLSKGSDGNFYGTTYRGGLALPICRDGAATSDPADVGCGAAYEITPAGEETVLHLFTGAPGDGLYPEVLIKGNDGNLYGTTQQGGANNLGTVFRITPDGVEPMAPAGWACCKPATATSTEQRRAVERTIPGRYSNSRWMASRRCCTPSRERSTEGPAMTVPARVAS
jgi:uncharacterized repeat protein (TIGR03803 family)